MNRFEELAQPDSKSTFGGDLLYYLKHRKKFWMIPIFLVLLLFGAMILLGGTAAAPFIYTLF